MGEKTTPGNVLNWRLLLYAALGAFLVFIPVAIWTSERLLYLFVVIPLVSIALIGVFLQTAAMDKKPRRGFTILSMLVIYWAVSAFLVANYSAVRSAARWTLWSHDYKAEVLAQNDSANGDFRHIEWDGWGFPGAGDTTVYLVFDPTDSLSAAAKKHQPGNFNGIPCEVPLVRRLESHWYSVRFYTDQSWGQCN